MRSKNVLSLVVNSRSRALCSNLHRPLPKIGPISQPSNAAPKVTRPMLMKGSGRRILVILSVRSGVEERTAKQPAKVEMEASTEETSE